jgi:hypothetical protein
MSGYVGCGVAVRRTHVRVQRHSCKTALPTPPAAVPLTAPSPPHSEPSRERRHRPAARGAPLEPGPGAQNMTHVSQTPAAKLARREQNMGHV